MNASTSITKKGASPAGVSSRARVSSKARAAIGFLAKLGCTQEQAAQLAGMNAAALSRALGQPHVQAALQEAKEQRIKAINASKPLYKALAWEQAHKLAQSSADERIRLKAVELLTGEGRPGGVQVNVQTNLHGGGYEFVPPNARVVDIALDQASSDTDVDPPEIADDDDDV